MGLDLRDGLVPVVLLGFVGGWIFGKMVSVQCVEQSRSAAMS